MSYDRTPPTVCLRGPLPSDAWGFHNPFVMAASPSNPRTSVVVVDDHPMYRAGVIDAIKRRPELAFLGEAADGLQALELIRELRPDVALVDLQLPGLDGREIADALGRDQLPTRVIILSAHFDSQTVYATLGAGASGYLSKDASGREICEAVQAVARGETVLGRDIQAAVAAEIRRREPRAGTVLSDREHEVLQLTADGLSAGQIAGRLHLSPTTVKTHLQRVYEKLGVSDRAAAVAEAMRRKLLQ